MSAVETPTPPVRVSLTEAIRRYWPLVLLPVVLLVAIGATVGLVRDPTYTAEARLAVGRIDVSEPGALSGFAEATQSLASAYSRAVRAEQVVNRVARDARESPDYVRDHVSASPVPESPVITMEGTGDSEAVAVRLANTASTELINYVERLNRTNPDSPRLLDELRRAVERRNTLESLADEAGDAFEESGSDTDRAAFDELRGRVEIADVRVDALRDAYSDSQQGRGTTSLLQVQTRAIDASNDRMSVFQLLVGIGLLGGLVIGLGLAVMRAQGAIRRTRLAGRRQPSAKDA
jgi:capsular polysaccharide biosynthesis protein